MTNEHHRNSRHATIAKWALLAISSGAILYLVSLLYLGGQPLLGTLVLAAFGLMVYVYTSRRAHAARYLLPGIVGILVFAISPVIFTLWLGLTNYSSTNILTFERATEVLLSKTYERGTSTLTFELCADGPAFRLVLKPEQAAAPEAEDGADGEDDSIFGDEGEGDSIFDDEGDDEGEGDDEDGDAGTEQDAETGDEAQDAGPAAEGGTDEDAGPDTATAGSAGDAAGTGHEADEATAHAPTVFVTEPVSLAGNQRVEVKALPLEQSGFQPGEPLSVQTVIARQDALAMLTVRLPDGTSLIKTDQGLTTFAAESVLYVKNANGTLTNQQTGEVLTPSFDSGFYVTGAGEPITPGFRVGVGLKHYMRIFGDAAFREPFVRIFIWTVVFSALTVLLTLGAGALLAELLDWEELRFRGLYRVLLFIPYAVPAFLSILVFKGLFNENIGEINLIMEGLFGLRPRWFTDPFLAKVMILVVNTWLGYPYMMLLWLGLRQSIPGDLYEASALAGAGPFTNFFKITWPLVRRPLMPLLISSFAFNFNNFTLIQLLTNGRPDFLDTRVPAGTTDILVTYTYRIAFQDTGQQFGLAAAISTVVFILVGVLSLINLRLTKVNQNQSS